MLVLLLLRAYSSTNEMPYACIEPNANECKSFFLANHLVQSTPDNSNLQEKSNTVRVNRSSKQITRSKEMGWGRNANIMHRQRIRSCFERNSMFWTAVHCLFFF